jgi:hypothetical protein
MASYLRPRRGKKATAIAQLTASAPLKRGEIFFEVPDTGVGTGYGNIKMGDGSTGYDALPYFNKQVIVDDTITQASTNPVQSAAIYTALQNIEADLGVELTQAEFDRLTPQQQATGTYYITDGGGSAIAIDTALDANSTNPVQNKAVTASITQLNNDLTDWSTNTITPLASDQYIDIEYAYGNYNSRIRIADVIAKISFPSAVAAGNNLFRISTKPTHDIHINLVDSNGNTIPFEFSASGGICKNLKAITVGTFYLYASYVTA